MAIWNAAKTVKTQIEPKWLRTIGVHNLVRSPDPEMIVFWGLAGPGGPGHTFKRWGASLVIISRAHGACVLHCAAHSEWRVTCDLSQNPHLRLEPIKLRSHHHHHQWTT